MSVLNDLVATIATGGIQVIDLTQTLDPDFPSCHCHRNSTVPAFPYRGNSQYDDRGPSWYWNNFTREHRTHFDAPIHWVSGRNLANNATDSIPVEHMVAPAVVIDCSKECASNADFLLTKEFIQEWEATHGQIQPGSWVLMRTDWSKKTSAAEYQNYDEEGAHTPGPDPDAVRYLVERNVLGFGSEEIDDAGQAEHLNRHTPPLLYARRRQVWPPVPDEPGPASGYRNRHLRSTSQDQKGSGPLRVLALVPGAAP